MRRLLLHITLFLLPIVCLLLLLPDNPRQRFEGLKDDCFNHGIWLYDRIQNDSAPIDIAFIGSSRTINGINDSIIQQSVFPLKVANLAYCRLGRDLQYSILTELIKRNKPKALYIEVREDENLFSHPVFPLISNTKVVLSAPIFNPNSLKNYWKHFAYKIELWQDQIFKNYHEAPVNFKPFGYAAQSDTASTALLQKVYQERANKVYPISGAFSNIKYSFPKNYLKKTARLCTENNINLNFIYIPAYGSPLDRPVHASFYENYGQLIIPPDSIFKNPDHWFDENHLNQTGSEKCSNWLAEFMQSGPF
jgi:hypothetical protein